MDCRICEKHINDYLDGELSKREEKKFQLHVRECKTCRMELDQYRDMQDQLANMEVFSPRRGFEDRILSQLQLHPKEQFVKVQHRNQRKDLILIFGFFATLFVVLSVLRNGVLENGSWISGIMVTGRVFRQVFEGMIFQGLLSLLVVYPIRIFHWARVNFSQMSVEGRMVYSLVVMNLLLIITFSHILLQKLAKGRGKNKGGSGDEIRHSRT